MTIAERAVEECPGAWRQHFVFPDGSEIGTWPTNEKMAILTENVELVGKRALDIGCMSGGITLWLRDQGCGSVLALDVHPNCKRQFQFIKQVYELTEVDYFDLSVYCLDTVLVPREWDVVAMLGVYYHLQHPLLGIQQAWKMTGEVLLLEGEVSAREGSVADFYKTDYRGDTTNWWVPSRQCFVDWLETLPDVSRIEIVDHLLSPSRIGARVWR